jgi:serine/threonine protein kinase
MTDETRFLIVPHFRFVHEPFYTSSRSLAFVGRSLIIDRLATRIIRSDGGSLLIIGYRGIGKTSLANALVERITSRLQSGTKVAAAARVLPITLAITRQIEPANLLHMIINETRLALIRDGIFDELTSAVQDEFTLAAMRTTADLKRTNEDRREARLKGSFDLKLHKPLSTKLEGEHSRGFHSAIEESFLPYDQGAVEQDVIRLARALTDSKSYRRSFAHLCRRFFGLSTKKPVRLMFIFDEIDKIENVNEAENALLHILSTLKTVLTTSGITFLFVAGIGTYEAWQADVSRGDSIFESIFSQVEYLPALWDVGEHLCTQLLSETNSDAPNISLFKKFLVFRGRGIPRRTLRTLYEFVEFDSNDCAYLVFEQSHLRGFRTIAELEAGLRQAEQELFSIHGGRSDQYWRDRDGFALRYLSDWILERGQEPFGMAELLDAGKLLRSMVSPRPESNVAVANALVKSLEQSGFLELISAVDPDASMIVKPTGAAIATWRVPQRRLIELGRKLGGSDQRQERSATLADRYSLQGLIGRGGFGVVHKAFDIVTQRRVAIKTLLEPASKESKEIFEREFLFMQSLDHPNIVRMLEGQLDGPMPYIVLEFIDGVPLTKLLRNQRTLHWSIAVQIAMQVLEAVEYLNSQNVIWGDIKAGNIIVEDTGHVRIIDFGSSRRTDGRASEHGVNVGTPRYMAPEWLKGQRPTVTSEIYSIGVLLYQMTTGIFPFDGVDGADIVKAIYSETPRLPSSLATIPDSLSSVIMRCLERAPENRFQSLSELGVSLPEAASRADLGLLIKSASAQVERRDAQSLQDTMEVPWDGVDDEISVNHWDGVSNKTVVVPSSGNVSRPSSVIIRSTVNLGGPLSLYVINGAKKQHVIIEGASATIGRSPENDIMLDDVTVSRYHARLLCTDDKWSIDTLNTINRTYVNGQEISGIRDLNIGDVLKIGAYSIELLRVDLPETEMGHPAEAINGGLDGGQVSLQPV